MTKTTTVLAEENFAALSLRENMLWTLAGNISSAASQWIILLLIVRLDTPEALGSFAMATALTSPIFLFASLHLRTVQATDMTSEFSFGIFLSLRLLLTAIAVCLSAICAGANFGNAGGPMIMLIALTRAVESLSDIAYGYSQKLERMDHIGKSMILRNVGIVAVVMMALGLRAGLATGILAGLVVSGSVLLWDLSSLPSWPGWNVDWLQMGRLLRKAAPLGLVLLLVSLNANLPRYILALNHGSADVGRFAAMSCFGLAANTLVMAMGQSAGPAMARAFQFEPRKPFLSKAAPLLGVAGVLAAVTVLATSLAGDYLLTLVYGREYAGLEPVLVWISFAGAAGYFASALGYIMSSSQLFSPQVPVLFSVSVVTVTVCYLLVPNYALVGAAVGQLAGSLVQVILSITVVTCVLRAKEQQRRTL